MDLRIEIKDENDTILELVVVYQDGSDTVGANEIAKLIRTHFTVDKSEFRNLPAKYRPQFGG